MKAFIGQATAVALGALASVGPCGAEAADKPYDGVTLNLASQNDQLAAVLAAVAPQFEALTGAKVNVEILSYPELLTKITADYVGHTKGYDLATVDIVWSGQFAEAGYTVDLTDWIKRDAAEIKVDDLVMTFGGKTVTNYDELLSQLKTKKPGEEVELEVTRNKETLKFKVVIGKVAG